MKIIHANFAFYPSMGGTENEVYQYSRRMVERGHDVTVITSNMVGYRQQILPREEIIDGIRVIRFPVVLPFPFSKLLIAPKMIWKLPSIEADVIHVFSFIPHFFTNYVAFYAIRRNIPLVWSPIYHPARQNAYKGLLAFINTNVYEKWLGLEMLRKASYVTALIPSEAAYYRERGIKNVIVKGLGLDDEVNCSQEDLNGFRERYNLTANTILFLSRIEKRKGAQHIIRAMPLVLQYYRNAKLLIAGGDMGYRSYLDKLCAEVNVRDSVVFTGNLNRSQIAYAFNVSKVFLLPSHYDVLPLAPLEAWLHKIPVIISSKVLGTADMVSPENGIVIEEPSDYEAIARAVIELLSNPKKAKAMGENGHRLVKEQFSWDRVVYKIEAVYKTVTSRREPSR